MDTLYLFLLAWMLNLSFQNSEEGLSAMDGRRRSKDQKPTLSSIMGILVKYDTLLKQGATVYSRAGVDTYSTILVNTFNSEDSKEAIYVGARNWLIKFDLKFNEMEAVEVPPKPTEIQKCKSKMPAEDCHNFVKYILAINFFAVGQIYVCGTYAYHPSCVGRFARELSKETRSVVDLSSANPREDVASYMAGTRLYLGLNMHMRYGRPMILGTQLNSPPRIVHTLKNTVWLNRAEIVGAFSVSKQHKFVYFVFRETAFENPTDNVTVSRIARICKNDKGGGKGHKHEFVTFIKASLGCGEFNKIQDVSNIENSSYFWATFTSDRQNGSAICGFRISDMDKTFQGDYWCRKDASHKWGVCPPPTGLTAVKSCFKVKTVPSAENYTTMSNIINHTCSTPPIVSADVLKKIAASPTRRRNIQKVFVGDVLGRVWMINFNACDVDGNVSLWEAVPDNETSKTINGLAAHDRSVIVLTNRSIVKIGIDEEYEGIVTNEPTDPATVTKERYVIYPSHAHSQFEFSCSKTTLLLISIAITIETLPIIRQ